VMCQQAQSHASGYGRTAGACVCVAQKSSTLRVTGLGFLYPLY
jgi:hypothetical protein